jgi:signal transduction histidine kinase
MPTIDLLPLLLIGVSPVALALAGIVGLRVRRLRRQLARLSHERDRALATASATDRQLRLCAGELRDTALTLRGHADLLAARDADPTGHAPGHTQGHTQVHAHARAIASATVHIFALADELLDHEMPGSQNRVLHEEKMQLGALVRDAIAATAATLGPSRRHWRIAPQLDGVTVRVDRRAMALVLLRVLGNAARFTSHDDWIDIGCARHDGDVVLIVADEGAGHPNGHANGDSGAPPIASLPASFPDRRGLGLGLTVARQLMHAHDGELTVETAPRIGTSVTLTLPAGRVGAMIDLPSAHDPR